MFDSLVAFGVLAVLLVLVPGLDTALVIRSTFRGSRVTAFATAFGIDRINGLVLIGFGFRLLLTWFWFCLSYVTR